MTQLTDHFTLEELTASDTADAMAFLLDQPALELGQQQLQEPDALLRRAARDVVRAGHLVVPEAHQDEALLARRCVTVQYTVEELGELTQGGRIGQCQDL